MISLPKWGVVAATALSVAALVSPVSASDDPSGRHRSAAPARVQVISLTSTSTGTTVVDNGTPGPGLGDQIIITAKLFRNGRSYGTEAAVCTRVAPATTHCVGTFSLPLGQLTWQHLKTTPVGTPPRDFDVAVTGGTGLYRTARGHAHIDRIAHDGGAFTLYLVR
ncbi:hypothetical protein OTC26_031070 [Streptomyces tirandamycinicus]|uniref:hypothetical protein n=1 Tax=Streptomyces tirandamycinicus TaxID=2174846 RepID=UPI000365B91A|nr:hypothetical protein [Streptomyces tirandamycinicus]MCY0985204.1 hypothetical protein [Streptomyces tirandamycinicus]